MLSIPPNEVLARLLKAKNLPVEIKKTGDNKYATYDNKISYDGEANRLTVKKLVPVLNGCVYEPHLAVQEWEIFVDGEKLDGRPLQ